LLDCEDIKQRKRKPCYKNSEKLYCFEKLFLFEIENVLKILKKLYLKIYGIMHISKSIMNILCKCVSTK